MSLHDIQKAVQVAKDKRNDFGGYNYRTAEGIMAAAKPHMPDGWVILCSDDIVDVAGQIFVSAIASINDEKGSLVAACSGHAMHPLTKKGMDPSQITGAASSYARKYALSGLLALDDGSVDPDATNQHKTTSAASDGLKAAEEDAILDSLPKEYTEQQLAEAYAARIEDKALSYKTISRLDGYMKSEQVKKWMDFISLVDDDMRKGTREKVLAHREGLK